MTWPRATSLRATHIVWRNVVSAPARFAINILGRFDRTMTDRETARLILHPVDTAQAQRIRDQAPSTEDRWAEGYPFEGDLAAIGGFLRDTDQYGDQRPFGYYQIIRQSDSAAVGCIGFKGPPDGGRVEIGYGLIPAARGHGYAGEALLALMAIAHEHGIGGLRADTTRDNIASQRTLAQAGFEQVTADDKLLHYEVRVMPREA
jgi:RimJ/RimL family protein N-acetyltransferase